MAKQPVRILVTDANGLVGDYLVPMISLGRMLGPDQPVILHLHHHDEAALKEFKMLLQLGPYPLLQDVIATSDPREACKNVEVAVLIGKVPKKTRILRSESMSMVNANKNYKLLAEALENYAAANCKVLVIAYPAYTLALTLRKFAPSIPPKNITCLTRSYHNCALGHICDRLHVSAAFVKNVIIWGNHLSPLHLDINHATVDKLSGEYSVRELINDDAWLNGEFNTYFQKRAALSIEVGGDSGQFLICKAACDHIHDWVLGTPEGWWVSMGLFSDGSYNVPAGLMYSFPVTSRNGEWTIVQGLPLDESSRKKMDSMVEELTKEHSATLSSIELHLCG